MNACTALPAKRQALPILSRMLPAAGALLLALGSPAHAGLFSDDEARKAILEVRDSLAEQDKQQQARVDALAKRLEQVEQRLEAIQRGQLEASDKHDASVQDLAKLRGVLEQLANDLANTQKRERDLYGDLDQRLRKFEPSAVTVDGKSVTVDHEEQSAYESALGQFRGGDYRGAVGGLGAFVARFPRSVYAPAAQFWLGSSYYAIKDFPSAISAQQALMERFPDSPRVPDALLNIAASQVEMNDRKAARATLQRIGTDYPDSEAARYAKERLAQLPAEKTHKAAEKPAAAGN